MTLSSLSQWDKFLKYLSKTVKEIKLDQLISFNHKMLSSNWSDEERCWSLTVESPEGMKTLKSRFLSILARLLYIIKEATVKFLKGRNLFQGKIICLILAQRPDFFSNRIAVIWSGGYRQYLGPSLANQGAGQVTMIQRSSNLRDESSPIEWTVFFSKKSFTRIVGRIADRSTIFWLSMASFGFFEAFRNYEKLIMKCGSNSFRRYR